MALCGLSMFEKSAEADQNAYVCMYVSESFVFLLHWDTYREQLAKFSSKWRNL